MLRRSCRCFLRSVVVVLIFCFMDDVASDCIPGLVYICEVPVITATVEKVAVVAPGRPPSCAPEAASCTTLITARQGEKIMVTGNTGISISPCNGDDYVQFSDESLTSPRHCQVSPRTASTTTPATEAAPLYMSKTNSMTVRYRSSGSESFMSIFIRAVGCPHDDLIDGNNIQVLEEAFSYHGYTVNVTCEPGYLLSNTSTNASASCVWNHFTQKYGWSINRKIECRDGSNGAPTQQGSPPLIGRILGGAVGGAIVLVVLVPILFIFLRKQPRNKGSQKAVLNTPSTQSENTVTAKYVDMNGIATNQRTPPSSSPSVVFLHSSPYEEITTTMPSSLSHMDHAGTQNPAQDYTGNYVNLTSGSQNPLTAQPEYESLIVNTNDRVYSSLEVR